jgi:site-specific recombinase XerD
MMQDLVTLGVYYLVTNHPPPPVERLLEKLASEHARRTYRRAIDCYLAWIERDPFQADPAAVANYKGELLVELHPSVVALRLRIVRELYEEAIEVGLSSSNPAATVSPPVFTPDASCVPPPAEIAAARLATCNRSREAGRRDYALFLLVVETNIQPDEVPRLTVADCRHEDGRGVARVRRGDSDTPVQINLSDALWQAIEEYLAGREVADDSPLFGLPRLCARRRGHAGIAGPGEKSRSHQALGFQLVGC